MANCLCLKRRQKKRTYHTSRISPKFEKLLTLNSYSFICHFNFIVAVVSLAKYAASLRRTYINLDYTINRNSSISSTFPKNNDFLFLESTQNKPSKKNILWLECDSSISFCRYVWCALQSIFWCVFMCAWIGKARTHIVTILSSHLMRHTLLFVYFSFSQD